MDFEQAKSIPLAFIFDKLGYQPIQYNNYETLYQSPFSKRQGDFLRLIKSPNIWTDDCLDKRGNPITFIITYLKHIGQAHTEKHALHWLEVVTGNTPIIQPIPFIENIHEEPGVRIKKTGNIEHLNVINYLRSKGIPHTLASRHMKQVQVYIPRLKKSVLAIGLKNEDRGWEIYNPNHPHLFTGTRNINHIRGRAAKPAGVHIFANIFDYYAAVIQKGHRLKFDNHSMILNCYSLLPMLTPSLRPGSFETAYTWLPNDQYGRMAKESLDKFFSLEPVIRHIPKNKLYADHTDVNSWHCARIEKMAST